MDTNKDRTELNKTGSSGEKTSILRDIIDIVESTLITIFVIVMVFTYVLHPVNIVGHSMVPTLNANYDASTGNSDKIFMSTVFFKVKYGDILVINKNVNYLLDESGNPYTPDGAGSEAIGECIIKRVIATGGQTVDIRDGNVIVDDKVLSEPYINADATTADLGYGAFTDQYPITIPEGYYFVMGDNRNHSTDSRARSVGLVKKDQIYGKALVRYSPLKDFDILTDSWKGSDD